MKTCLEVFTIADSTFRDTFITQIGSKTLAFFYPSRHLRKMCKQHNYLYDLTIGPPNVSILQCNDLWNKLQSQSLNTNTQSFRRKI